MIRVDFYILATDQVKKRDQFACRLSEKVYRQNHLINILTNSTDETDHLNSLLWHYAADSFLAHNSNKNEITFSPIHVHHGAMPEKNYDILINLATNIPDDIKQYKRIAEIVFQDDKIREAKRLHYQYYKNNQFELHTHNLDF